MHHVMPIGASWNFLAASCRALSITFQFLPLRVSVTFGAFAEGFQRLGQRFLRVRDCSGSSEGSQSQHLVVEF